MKTRPLYPGKQFTIPRAKEILKPESDRGK